MLEILITIIIVLFAGFVIFKSLKNFSEGKCSSGCGHCKAKNACSDKVDSK